MRTARVRPWPAPYERVYSGTAMLSSITWRALWPLGAATVVTGALWLAALRQAEHTRASLDAVVMMRDRLDRAVVHIVDRHIRTLRRAREATLEPRLDRRVAMLTWTSEHYLREMTRFTTEARRIVDSIQLPGADPRLAADLSRLTTELEQIDAQAQEVAAGLDLLLGAVSAEDAEAFAIAVQEIDIADSVMQTDLRIAEGVARRASTWQVRQSLRAPERTHLWGAGVLAWALAAILIAYRPLRRISLLARGERSPRDGARSAASREERMLAERLAALETEIETERGRQEEHSRESERAQQVARRAEQELALLKLYNENLVNSLRSAIVVTDAAGTITSFNRPARELLALNEEHVGTPLEEHGLYGALASRSRAREELDRALRTREVLRKDGLKFSHPSAGEILLDLTVAPYVDESGAARGLLWVSDDVTDAVRIKKQLLATEHLAAVGRLSAQVAHEIRNPLSAIGLNAEMLEEEFAGVFEGDRRDEALALLRGIAAEIERLTEVTEGYLQLARMPMPSFRDADLNQLVGDLFTMLDEELRAYQVEVHLDLATPPPRAWVDPGQLRQAMLNVVRNAREAMVGGGTLHIATRTVPSEDGDEMAEISICDSGEGIPDEILRRIFEPFYSTKPNGTGLGLSLTQQILTEHGGSITVEHAGSDGTNDHRGTRVTLRVQGGDPPDDVRPSI